MTDEIRDAVAAMLRTTDHTVEFDRPLWKTLAGTGFHLLGVPEELGGSGGGLDDLATVVDETAYHAANVPVVESAFLAGWLLTQAGIAVPDGLTVASLDEADAGDGLSGRLRTPWARYADHVVTIARRGNDNLVAIVPIGPDVVFAENLAGEPRDTLVLGNTTPSAVAVGAVNAAGLLRRGALARSIQLAGAARAVLDTVLRHVGEREQFGRPLARFQAVQQQLAALAAEVTAMRVSADAAVLATETDEAGEAGIAIAAAKATCSASAHTVAAIGHQLLGALGYSREHALGRATTRLWAWREEFGNESHWHDHLAGAGDCWSLVTGTA